MEVHEFSHIFPLMPDDQIRVLAADILIHGLHKPIMLHPDGRILDGRARHLACQLIGVTPMVTIWNGVGSPFVLLVHLNLEPRQLTMAQRALVGGRIYFRQAEHPEQLQQKDIATLVNVSTSALHRTKAILQRGIPELIDSVSAGSITLAAGSDVAGLPAHEQRTIIGSGTAGHIASELRKRQGPTQLHSKRLQAIRELAAAGHDSAQIAGEVGITQDRCRFLLKRAQIDCPGDRAHGRSRRHDPVRIIEHIVMDAENLLAGEDLIDWEHLHIPSARLAELIATADAARDSLGSFIRKLRKERSRNDHEAA